MGTMLRTTWGQLDATTLSDFSKVLTENITSNKFLLWALGQQGGITTRSGGKTIVEPIILDESPNTAWISELGTLNMTKSEGITAAEYAWKILSDTMTLSGLEMFQNSGPNGMIDLWNAKGKQMGISMRNALNAALFSDGSANGGTALIGLLAAIENGDTWTTYGTIDSNANTNWRNQFVDTATYSTSTNFLDGLRQLHMLCTAGGDMPDIGIMTQTLYQYFLSLLEAQQQFVRVPSDENVARAGFQNIVYMGVPHSWDTDMLPNTSGDDSQGLVLLNLDYLKLVFGEGFEFAMGEPVEPDNQFTTSVKCIALCNLVVSNRRRQGRDDYQS